MFCYHMVIKSEAVHTLVCFTLYWMQRRCIQFSEIKEKENTRHQNMIISHVHKECKKYDYYSCYLLHVHVHVCATKDCMRQEILGLQLVVHPYFVLFISSNPEIEQPICGLPWKAQI